MARLAAAAQPNPGVSETVELQTELTGAELFHLSAIFLFLPRLTSSSECRIQLFSVSIDGGDVDGIW